MTDINLSRTFCAHECNALGLQALAILKRLKQKADPSNTNGSGLIISGGDPAVPQGAVLFLKLPIGECSSSFLRIHPLEPVYPEDRVRQQFLEDHMPWALKGRVVFINPRYASKGDAFAGKPLRGFTSALTNLVGFVDLEVKARRKKAKAALRAERRAYPVRDRLYFVRTNSQLL